MAAAGLAAADTNITAARLMASMLTLLSMANLRLANACRRRAFPCHQYQRDLLRRIAALRIYNPAERVRAFKALCRVRQLAGDTKVVPFAFEYKCITPG